MALPVIASTQNAYNPSTDLRKPASPKSALRAEKVGLLAYSPPGLRATGTGRGHLADRAVRGASTPPGFGQRHQAHVAAAVAAYVALAREHGISPTCLALGFVLPEEFLSAVPSWELAPGPICRRPCCGRRTP